MPANIVPVNTWTTPLTGPANGDPVNGGAGGPSYDMGQKLSNRIEFLKDRTLCAIANDPLMFPLLVLPQATNYWQGGAVPGGCNGILQTDVGAARVMWIELVQPKYCKLITLTLTVVGATGHPALPSTPPGIALYRQDPGSAAAATLVQSATDPSANVGAYQVPHGISLIALTEILIHDGGSRFYLRVAGEFDTGANARVDLCVLHLLGDTLTA